MEKSDRIICPFCGEDVTDFFMDDDIIDPKGDFFCPFCGGVMEIEMDVAITYVVTPVFDKTTNTEVVDEEAD